MSCVQTAAQHFDRLAARYSELRTSGAEVDPVAQAIVELGRLEGGRVLDVGCGPGAVIPDGETLSRELLDASFTGIRVEGFELQHRFSRAEALVKIRARTYSSFVLMSDEDYDAGLAAAEDGLPAEVGYDLRLLNVLAG